MKDGYHTPTLIATGKRTSLVSQLSEMPATHAQRMLVMEALGRRLAKDGKVGQLRQVIFISEGWMSAAAGEKPPSMRPSQDPHRKEVLIVSGLQVQANRKHLRLFEMVRDAQRKVVDVPEIEPDMRQAGSIEVPLLDAFVKGFGLAVPA